MIEVVRTGPLATVQDLGRPGLAHLGVGRSGAADVPALRLANRLVGNPEDAACLEVTLGGLVLRFQAAHTVALAGAPCPMWVGGRQAAPHGPVHVGAGEELRLDLPPTGLRSYLAVRGGLAVPPVLGSRSTDVLAGLGPPVPGPGAVLPVGPPPEPLPVVDVAPVPPYPVEPVLRVLPGPREDWFAPEALAVLYGGAYTVSPDSNRIGVRLSGPVLARAAHAVGRELPSEGVVTGSLQVPPAGQPVLFLADSPVTGGYPVIAVVEEEDLALAAQARPGEVLRFRPAAAAEGR